MMAFARWNLACCELLGWKETARHLNPMLSGSVMMFWERTCSKLPICLNFCGTAFLQQQPESYCEACLLTLYRVYSRASPCVAYGVWSLNLFIFPTSIFFKKKKKISAEQPCSSSSFAPYPHLISPPLVCSNRCRNKENLLLFFPFPKDKSGERVFPPLSVTMLSCRALRSALLFWPGRFNSILWGSAFTSRRCTTMTYAQRTEEVKFWIVK